MKPEAPRPKQTTPPTCIPRTGGVVVITLCFRTSCLSRICHHERIFKAKPAVVQGV